MWIKYRATKMIKEMKATGIPIDVQLLPYMAMVTLDDVLK